MKEEAARENRNARERERRAKVSADINIHNLYFWLKFPQMTQQNWKIISNFIVCRLELYRESERTALIEKDEEMNIQ